MAILGFSSSPIKGGNVDRMVQALLEKSGKTTEFVNLTELSYGPDPAGLVLISAQEITCATSKTI